MKGGNDDAQTFSNTKNAQSPPTSTGSGSKAENVQQEIESAVRNQDQDTEATSKMDFLPRLRRQQEIDAAAGPSAPRSMADRLAQMRVEDRRRIRNQEARNDVSQNRQNNKSSLRAEAQSFQPSTSFAVSASSRAGALYLSSSRLAQQDALETQRQRALGQKFAGPAPPTSWRRPDGQASTVSGDGSLTHIDESDSSTRRKHELNRRSALNAARHFLPDTCEDDCAGGTMSLVDLSLCAIASHVAADTEEQYRYLNAYIHLIPPHLKERLLALCGRFTKASPIAERMLSLLFPVEQEHNAHEQGQEAHLERQEEKEEDDDFIQDWDASSSEHSMTRTETGYCPTLDLSFANISAKAIVNLLGSTDIRASHLRSLSLAGWGASAENLGYGGARAKTKCLRTNTRLLNVFNQLVNLQVLSLAASRLLPYEDDNDDEAEINGNDDGAEHAFSLSMNAVSEAVAFLKKLSRHTSRLVTLDLSACRWLNGAVIANVGWYSFNVPVRRLAWPQLEHLVLNQCPAFSEAVPDKASLETSSAYVATWHAAHHGSSRATDSPYFLAHKPGLGRALLADGFGVWDSAMGKNNLVGREAAALSLHGGQVRQAQTRSAGTTTARSAFDDEDGVQAYEEETRRTNGRMSSTGNFAISHGNAPFTSNVRRRPQREGLNVLGNGNAPRCPVSRAQVSPSEWQRARVLDAVQGRWGSAILGTIDDEVRHQASLLTGTQRRRGVYTTVYF